MSGDLRLDEQLRSLDSATPLTAAEQSRAASTLERIVAGAGDAPGPDRAVRRSRRRLVLAAAVAAAVALGGVAVVLPGGLGGGQAYASWTPAPTPLTGAEAALIEPRCRDALAKDRMWSPEQSGVVLAERRGEFAALLYRSRTADLTGFCLAHNVPGSDDVDDVVWGVAGGTGPAQTAPPRGYTQGAIADFRDASSTEGAVGADVTGVTIHAGHLTVQASVADGRYAAWWPGPAFPQDVEQPSGEGGPEPFLTYDLTLRDGTVLQDAQPALPR